MPSAFDRQSAVYGRFTSTGVAVSRVSFGSPKAQPPEGPASALHGDSERTKIAESEEHSGDKTHAPGEKGTDFDVLRTPPLYPQHRRYIAETYRAGTVGVHLTSARGVLHTDDEGSYRFWCVTPTPYPIPTPLLIAKSSGAERARSANGDPSFND